MPNMSGLIQWSMAAVLTWALALPAVANPDPAEFEKVQRAMNERIEHLEAELNASRQEWRAKEGQYQAQLSQLEQRSQRLESALEDTDQPPPGARDWGQGWSVRRPEPALAEPTGQAVEDLSAIGEADADLQEEPTEAAPFEVTEAVRLGVRRLSNRREDVRWRAAMEFNIRNLTDTPLRISAYAHQPGRMGWNLDEYGVKMLVVPPLATVTGQRIPHDKGTELHIMINDRTYTFEVKSR